MIILLCLIVPVLIGALCVTIFPWPLGLAVLSMYFILDVLSDK